MYFSVPLSDSHSSESGSRLFAIRSRIYNSARSESPPRSGLSRYASKRYAEVYNHPLKSPRPNTET